MAKPRIGEKVKTPKGEGYVLSAYDWKDEIRTMSGDEAVLYAQDLRARYGAKWQEKFCRVCVGIGKGQKWFESRDIEVIESRE